MNESGEMDPREAEAAKMEMTKAANEAGEQIAWAERAKRLERVLRDEECRTGLAALLRTITNASITVADVVPVLGEVASWSADACKFIARRTGLKALDLSPDVPEWVAYVSEGLEPMMGGVFPSHAIETGMQLKADLPRMRLAAERVQKIWNGQRLDDPKVIEATAVILNDNDDVQSSQAV